MVGRVVDSETTVTATGDSTRITLQVQSLKEIKKSRRTVMLGDDVLPIPTACADVVVPLTPPLSDRASGDVDELFSPEREEHFESLDLSDEDGAEVIETWDHSGEVEGSEMADPLRADGQGEKPQKPRLTTLRRILESAPETLPRESCLPSPPPMTIHDFWANVVRNYVLVHRTMPVFLFHKIRDGGVPSVLRRVVWMAMAGITPEYATEMTNIYTRLEGGGIGGWDKDIGRDLNRTWPDVEMFKEQDGHGQRGLRGVLAGYSVWDNTVGYCQGLGFLAGPLLMQTASPAEAFTLLTVLMSQPTPNAPTGYSLRTLYTPNFPGLLSLIHSFNTILTEQFPTLSTHLESMGLTTQLYAPQWFLSMFAVTAAPLDSILLRIWDLLMMEGVNGGYTMIRIGLALMKLKQDTLLELTEMEDGLKLLLSKDLWTDIEPNTLIGLAGGDLKTHISNERLAELNVEYQTRMSKVGERKAGGEMQAVVGRFFGKLKATASQLSVDTTSLVAPPMLRSLSRASFASSSSPQDAEPERPTLLRVNTEGTLMSRSTSTTSARGTSDNERALHGQIEELVRVLGEVQRRVGESERDRDHLKMENSKLREMLAKVAEAMTPSQTPGNPIYNLAVRDNSTTSLSDEISEILFSQSNLSSPSSSISQYPASESTDTAIRTQLSETQHVLNQERQANVLLQQQLSTTETELSRTRTALFDLRSKLAEATRRERSPSENSPSRGPPSLDRGPSPNGSLRELKLVVKTEQTPPKGTAGSIHSAGGSWGGWFGRS